MDATLSSTSVGKDRYRLQMRIGLALGGGGVVGVAWEIGVLQALQEAGFDIGGVELTVGTSAGSLIGSRLLHGHSLADMEAEQARPDPIVGRGPTDFAALAEVFQIWVSEPQMTPDLARRVAAKAMQTSGVSEEELVAAFAHAVGTDSWPPGDLRIATVAASTGERVAWTAADEIPLTRAVAASCAVPGIFPPITIGDDRYVDGGVWSGSNADLLGASEVEAMLFIGPMSGAPNLLGQISASALTREAAALEVGGAVLRSITPGPRFAEVAHNLMDSSQREAALRVGRSDGAAAAERLGHVFFD